jgi:hypothetical protein
MCVRKMYSAAGLAEELRILHKAPRPLGSPMALTDAPQA